MDKQSRLELLTETLAENHFKLSPVGLDFIRYALQNEESEQARLGDRDQQPVYVQNYPFELQMLPLFLSHAKSQEWGQVAVDLFSIYRKLVQDLARQDPVRLAQYFKSDCDEDLLTLFEGDTGLDYCLARGDFMSTAEGFKLLEFNVSGNLGGWGIYLFEGMYRAQPLIKRFMEGRDQTFSTYGPLNEMVTHILRVSTMYRRRLGFSDPRLNVGVFVEQPARLAEAEDMIARIKRQLLSQSSLAIDFTCCTHADDLMLEEGAVFTKQGRLDSMLLFGRPQLLPEFVHQLSQQGRFPIFNTRSSTILGQKSGLSLLSEHAQSPLASDEERQLINNHLPWTRLVRPGSIVYQGVEQDLLALLLQRQDGFVIKPIDGLQGREVSVGNRLDAASWQAVVDQALARPGQYIAQELCVAERLLARNPAGAFEEHDVIWAPFVFGGQFAGSCARTSPSNNETGVINAHRGATDAITFLTA